MISEISEAACGRRIEKLSAAGTDLFIDLGLRDRRILRASFDAAAPGLWLSNKAHVRDQKSEGVAAFQPFLLKLRKETAGLRLLGIAIHKQDRIVRLDLGNNEAQRSLVIALTGRSANSYLLDQRGTVAAALHEKRGPGVGEAGASLLDLNGANEGGGLQLPSEPEKLSQVELESAILSRPQFGPILRAEFQARCRLMAPAAALKSLMAELTAPRVRGIVYSRRPIEEFGDCPVALSRDLWLIHIELEAGKDMIETEFATLSEAADAYYGARLRAREFQSRHETLLRRLAGEIKKRQNALDAVESDLAKFSEPESIKKKGDLLLAGIGSIKIAGGRAEVIDYFEPGEPRVFIDLGECATPQEAAAHYYGLYRKAKRAIAQLEPRAKKLGNEVKSLGMLKASLEDAPPLKVVEEVSRAAARLLNWVAPPKTAGDARKNQSATRVIGRRFMSSDGLEVVVGRNDDENDYITFRLAGSLDLWLHAADYPGSHVVVRNPKRDAVPHRTIIEAAELAAFYSQAKKQTKAAVHYTQKKFVSKPPRSKPGLVRLSSFKTIMVEPKCGIQPRPLT